MPKKKKVIKIPMRFDYVTCRHTDCGVMIPLPVPEFCPRCGRR